MIEGTPHAPPTPAEHVREIIVVLTSRWRVERTAILAASPAEGIGALTYGRAIRHVPRRRGARPPQMPEAHAVGARRPNREPERRVTMTAQ